LQSNFAQNPVDWLELVDHHPQQHPWALQQE
jgi:hypothetical protein